MAPARIWQRALHYLGLRRGGPFVPVDCGALPETLFEGELFGHARGAFTDSRHEMRGLIAQAEGGALFIDEIHTLSTRSQAAQVRYRGSTATTSARVNGSQSLARDLDSSPASTPSRSLLAADPQRGDCCVGRTPTLADVCLVPKVESARSFKVDTGTRNRGW